MTPPIATTSPRLAARLGGFFWLLTFVTGLAALAIGGGLVVPGDAAATAARLLAGEPLFRWGIALNLVATACYVAATLFVYELLTPVSRSVSLLAAFFSLVGCAVGALSGFFGLAPLVFLNSAQQPSALTAEQLQALALLFRRWYAQASSIGFLFFGLHCLLVGCLILRSTFMPRIVGALMVLAGAGWLSQFSVDLLAPALGRSLATYLLLPGMLGEATLTLWLLVMGVNAQRWREQAARAGVGGGGAVSVAPAPVEYPAHSAVPGT